MRALVCFLLFSLPVMLPAATRAAEPPAPNILFLLVDDLGYADLGCYGSQFHRTPEIDALARSGIRFTQAYSAGSVCSPTRASILTGRHPVAVGITDWIPGANANRVRDGKFAHVDDLDHLRLSEITLAKTLAAAGYQNAFVGKWHLGGKGFLPTDQGFDINIGGFDVGSPPGGYYSPWKNPYLKNQRDGEYLTTRLTDESIAWLNTRDTQRPFFLMLSYYNVHTPIQPDRETIATYQADAERRFRGPTPTGKEGLGISRLRQDNPAYASMVGAVDRSVGRLLSWLEEQSLDQNTVVVLTSDNGGLCTLNRGRKADRKGPTCNLPLRSGKGWLYEGGIRVPAIIRLPKSIRERLPERDEPRQAVPSEEGPAQEGPAQDGPAVVGSGQGRAEPKGGVIEKGGVFENGGVIDTPINSFDWMPTLLAACGIKMDIANLDGVDIFQLQSAKGVQNANGPQNANSHPSGTRNLYWHYPHYHGSAWRPGGAIRTDRYKLIEFFEDDRVELYDLKADPGETNDLSAKRPEIAAVLRSELSQWRARSGAVMPTLR